jgi:hypothetical protein
MTDYSGRFLKLSALQPVAQGGRHSYVDVNIKF